MMSMLKAVQFVTFIAKVMIYSKEFTLALAAEVCRLFIRLDGDLFFDGSLIELNAIVHIFLPVVFIAKLD
jgi:hypothetical protein